MPDGTFIKVHDGMPDHPKVEALSDGAFRLVVTLWCWCARHKTDGRVPLATWNKRGTPKTRRELLTERLAFEYPDHVAMHDYLDWQRSAAQIEADREQRRTAGRAGGLAKGKRGAKRPASGSLSETASETEADIEGFFQNPQADEEQPPLVPPKPKTSLDNFQPDSELVADIRPQCPDVDLRFQTQQWRDYHREHGTKIRDFRASWRRWMRKQQEWHGSRSRSARTAQTGYGDADRSQPATVMTGNQWREGA
jgi:hypothetical protein